MCIGDMTLADDWRLLTDSKSITVDWAAAVNAKPRVERLVDNGMRGSRQELPNRSETDCKYAFGALGAANMRQLNGLCALVNDESTHGAP